ncbi:unnamed protein product [Brugia timori]|uniref:Uncharacterized protein n=1 Tax=Brugia timori TaxID=42155 RepID=A0A0R3RBN7_9BILA|nr:unnamed protein product [Brugia timori]
MLCGTLPLTRQWYRTNLLSTELQLQRKQYSGPPHTINCRMASQRICDITLGPKADIRLGKTMIFLKEDQHLLLQQVVDLL